MESNTKSTMIIGGAALLGGWGGSHAATRIGASLGMGLGPWGAAAGALIGALVTTSLARKMLNGQSLAMLDPADQVDATADVISE